MSNTRVQVRDLPVNQLRSAPVARDAFVQTSAPIANRDAENLIDALGFFNQNLSGLGTAMRVKRQKGDDELAQAQANQIQLSTEEQRAEIVRTGMINGEPLASAQVKRMAGAADGAPWLAAIKADLGTQDLSGVDVEAVIHSRAREHMKGVNGDKFVSGGFAPYVDDAVAWARQQQTAQGLQDRENVTNTTTFQFAKTKVGEWVQQGVTPEQLHANVRQLYTELGVGRDRIATTQMMDGNIMSIASQLVDENPEMALALVTQERQDADGKAIGSFADDPRYSNQVASVVERGRRVKREQETTILFNETRRGNLERVVQGGDYGAFQTITGPNGKELKAEEQKAQFTQDLTTWVGSEVAAGRMTEARGREEVRRYTARLGIDNPLVKEELDGLERRYSTADFASDPNLKQDLERRMGLIKEYKSDQRQALYAQLSGPTKDFADAFDAYKRFIDPSTEGAFEFANQVVNPTDGVPQGLAFKRADISSKVQNHLSGFMGFGSSSLEYSTLYAGQIEKVADLYVRAGMDVERAVDAAAEKVLERTPHYGGDPLRGLEGQQLPEDYQDVLGQMAEDYKLHDARGRDYEGTPTFVHLDGGLFAMRDRESAYFLEDENGRMIVFNLQHLRKVSNERATTRDAEAVRAATEAQRRFKDHEVKRTEKLNLTPDEQRDVIDDRVVAPARGFMDFLRDTFGSR